MRIILPTLIGLTFSFNAFSLGVISMTECQNIVAASEKLANQNFRSVIRVNIDFDGQKIDEEVKLEYKNRNAELLFEGKESPDIDKSALGKLLKPLTLEDCEFIQLSGSDLLVKISKGESVMMSREFNYDHIKKTLTPINMSLNANVSVLFVDYSLKTNFHFKSLEILELR